MTTCSAEGGRARGKCCWWKKNSVCSSQKKRKRNRNRNRNKKMYFSSSEKNLYPSDLMYRMLADTYTKRCDAPSSEYCLSPSSYAAITVRGERNAPQTARASLSKPTFNPRIEVVGDESIVRHRTLGEDGNVHPHQITLQFDTQAPVTKSLYITLDQISTDLSLPGIPGLVASNKDLLMPLTPQYTSPGLKGLYRKDQSISALNGYRVPAVDLVDPRHPEKHVFPESFSRFGYLNGCPNGYCVGHFANKNSHVSPMNAYDPPDMIPPHLELRK